MNNLTTVEARNLWHETSPVNSSPVLKYEAERLLAYRGVSVFKNPATSGYDYILADAVITQRASFDLATAHGLIDSLLAPDSQLSCAAVFAHIRANVKR